MPKAIAKAIDTHQANTAPAAIRRALRAAKRLGYGDLVTAAGIRAAEADHLREVLASEAGR